MFKQAIQNHTSPTASKVNSAQKSLLSTFRHAPAAPAPTTRPLSTGSGNVVKHNTAAERRTPSQAHGIKRTSSGLAKALSSQGDGFVEYPTLNHTSSSENGVPAAFATTTGDANGSGAGVFFNSDDFDSDLDLEVEDLATKDTVHYPKLPTPKAASTPRDSGVGIVDSKSPSRPVPDSSQAISWASSPPEHFRPTTQQVQPPQHKRRTLPWLQSQSQSQSQSQLDTQEEVEEEEEVVDTKKTKKRKSTETAHVNATPMAKAPKSEYPWNTTASAVKQQQKSLREAKKKFTKANEGSAEEVQMAKKKKQSSTVHRIFLSEEQQQVLNLVVENKKSVFFTGSAGTGKSVLLREIIYALRKKYIREPDRVAVTASTGLAACNIGGVTLHSFSGIGLGKESAEDLVKKIRKQSKARQRWLRTKVLIMDEISMVDGELFDKLEQIARTIRNNGRPFGGIQLIITGDFFQLPPVGEGGKGAKFAFDAGTWNTSIEHTIGLHHVFRQKDPVFANMLNEMREGRMTPESISAFRSLHRALPASDDNVEATELFPTRNEVERANTTRMQQLHGDIFYFDARDGGQLTDKAMRDRWLQNCIAPEKVALKKGAQVMLIKNMDETLVNGSLGKVTGFMTERMFDIYKDNEEAFLTGNVDGPTESEMRAQQKASLLGVNTQQVYPVVRFSIQDGTTRDLLCKRESWKFEQPNGEVLASREQVPLILAWALSIHKAQGQTLERVRVDLGKAFEKGQAYVALSRATNMAGLQVLNFNPGKVQAHHKVRQFYSGLSRAETLNEKSKAGASASVLAKMMKSKKEG